MKKFTRCCFYGYIISKNYYEKKRKDITQILSLKYFLKTDPVYVISIDIRGKRRYDIEKVSTQIVRVLNPLRKEHAT